MRITEADLRVYLDQGWNVIYTNISPNDRPEWGMWECIRELVQNALDEVGHYRIRRGSVDGVPTLFVEDDGKGMFVVNLIMGSGEKPHWARGRFGEGLKYACLVALRSGYDVRIETVGATILPVILDKEVLEPRKKQTVLVPILAFLYIGSEREQGTSIAIIGYDGDDYSDRFAINRKDEIASYNLLVSYEPSVVYKIQMFSGDEDPPGVRRLYVRDIYVADMNEIFSGATKALYSYNLYDVDLTRERNTPESSYQVANGMGNVIGKCKDKKVIARLLKTVSEDTNMEYAESRANPDIDTEAVSIWQEVFTELFGEKTVLYTEDKYSKRAEWEGYKVVRFPVYWNYSIAGFLRIPTDDTIAERTVIKRVYSRDEWTDHAEAIIDFFMMLTIEEFSVFRPGLGEAKPVFSIGELFDAVGVTIKNEIIFDLKALENPATALDTYIHELAHFITGAEDLTKAHLHEVSRVGSHVALLLTTNRTLKMKFRDLINHHFGRPMIKEHKKIDTEAIDWEKVRKYLEMT